MDLRKELTRILTKNYISHDDLWIESGTNALYTPVSDHQKVFVKALKNYDQDGEVAHIQNGVDFSTRTEYGTVALLESVKHQLPNGFPFFFSVWEWENRTPVGRKLTPELAIEAATELAKIHACTKYPELQEKSVNDIGNYGRGFSSAGFMSLSATIQNMLKDVYNMLVKPGTELLALNPMLNVVSHGNANLNKFVTRDDGQHYWTQYEWVRSAPREYDLANVYYSIRLQLRREDLWELFKHTYETVSEYTINPSHLSQLILLTVGREVLDASFYGLSSSSAVTIESYVRQLKPLMSGKEDIQNVSHFPLLQL